jgi:hypothetical protein
MTNCTDCGRHVPDGQTLCAPCAEQAWGERADSKQGRLPICQYCCEPFTPAPDGCTHHCLTCCDCCDADAAYDEDDAADEREHVAREERG